MADIPLVTISFLGKKVTVHQAIAPALMRVDAYWQSKGGNSWYRIDSAGGFNDRNIAGTGTKSWHAFGLAIDINPSKNPVGGKGDLPPDLVNRFKAEGFGWGGDWKSKKDPMHFSAGANEGGDMDRFGLSATIRKGNPTAVIGRPAQEGTVTIADSQPVPITADEIRAMYQVFAGRDPDAAVLARYAGRTDRQAVTQEVAASPEAQRSRAASFGLALTRGDDDDL